jgi:sigma-B regulation protein RsbU (phosphoserine phosphatase)
MKLRQKTLLITIVTLISLIGVLYWASSSILLKSIQSAEQREAEQSISSFLTLFLFTQQNFSEPFIDWSAWDATYEFLKDRNQQYIDDNFSSDTLTGLKLDVMLFIKPSGELLFGNGFGKQELSAEQLPPLLRAELRADNDFLQHPDSTSIKTGILFLPGHPLWVVSLPILPSSRQGPSAGSLLVGRYLNAEYWSQLEKITHLPIMVYHFDSPHLPAEVNALRASLAASSKTFLVRPVNEEVVHGYTLLNDIHEQPSLIFQLDIPRTAYQQGQTSVYYLIMVILASGIVFCIVMLLSLEKWVLLRLDSLSAQVKKIGETKDNFFMHVNIDGRDEFAQLANALNDMLGALQMAQVEIKMLNEYLKEENVRMSAELSVTRRLQQMVLPKPAELLKIADLDISGFMEPAAEVGGDYYDVLEHNGRVILGIGDVTGHGLESGVLMLMVQMAIRTLLTCDVTNLKTFLDVLNRALYANIQRMNTDKTLSLLLLDRQGGVLHLSGQHEEVLIVRQGGVVERVDTMELGFTIGLEENIADFIGELDVKLQPGDGIVLYTDGITEAENPKGEFYGIERLCHIISQSWSQSATQIQQAVIADVRSHISTQKIFDDITLVVLKKKE